jgi:dTDP-4-dehydrorhamnose 3,5-epimerase
MFFKSMPLAGVVLIEPDRREDERGFFARAWCAREFADHGIDAAWVQSSISHNRHKGTLRGLHFRRPPHDEAKLVRCTRGAIHDVVLDLRRGSASFTQHVSVLLSADNAAALYVPKGLAHGFQTLEDDTDVLYLMSEFYAPEHEAGVRWDDPAFDISWPPAPRRIISARDAGYPDFDAA